MGAMKTVQLPEGIQSEQDLHRALKSEFGVIKSETTHGPKVPGEWRESKTTHTVSAKTDEGLRLATVSASWDDRTVEIYGFEAREILWEPGRALDGAEAQAALDILEPRIRAGLEAYSSEGGS